MSWVLVDSSAWISYFRRPAAADHGPGDALDALLTDDRAAVNELILTELLPLMRQKNEVVAADLLASVYTLDLAIDWPATRALAERCLHNGINGVGIPDLLIARQAMTQGVPLLTLDKHFALIARIEPSLRLWPISGNE